MVVAALDISQALAKVRTIENYPIPGVTFQDITPLLSDSQSFNAVVGALSTVTESFDFIAGVEARGFILASAMALHTGTGFIPIRKKGKLPSTTYSRQYGLEYGTDELEIHIDAFPQGSRVLLVDDVLATGGTIDAAIQLITDVGGEVSAISVLMEIEPLGGRKKLAQIHPKVKIYTLNAIQDGAES